MFLHADIVKIILIDHIVLINIFSGMAFINIQTVRSSILLLRKYLHELLRLDIWQRVSYQYSAKVKERSI